MHIYFMVLVCSADTLGPGRAEASLHRPLFGEDAWKSHFDLGIESLVI